MKLKNRRLSALAAVTLVAGLALSACGGDDGDDNSSDGGGGDDTYTFLPKNLGNAYFDTSDNAGKAAIESFGGTYQEVGPDKASPDAQVPFINTAAQQGVAALIVSANDKEAICDALNEARDAGVKVVTFDSDTNPECRDLFINQATAEGIAKVQVDMIAEQIGDAGEVAILSAAANATNQNAWIADMEKQLAENHPNIQLVDTVYGDDDDQTSFDKTAALLQAHPNLKGIISPTTVGIAAAARYLSTSDAKGKVALTGLGTPNQMREYVEDGTVKEFALWNPGDLGTLAAYAAKALVDGDIKGDEGDTFTAGDLGEFTVDADGTVLLGEPYRSTRKTSATSTSESSPLTTEKRGPDVRVCFQLQVKPDRLAEYKERHAHVWPDMLAALHETGWHNYSLFVRDDGLLIGYFETPSLEAALAGMAAPR